MNAPAPKSGIGQSGGAAVPPVSPEDAAERHDDLNWASLLGLDAWASHCRACLAEGIIAVEDRAELASLEWAGYRQRLKTVLITASVAAGLTMVMLIMLSIAVLVHFWESPHRTIVAWVVGALWLCVWGVVMAMLAAALRTLRNPFALTRAELARDWKAWRKPS